VSTADLVALDDEVLQTVADEAAAIFELEQTGRGRRRFTFREVRQRSFSTEPFLYTLRSGGGFSEDLPAYERQVDHDLRRKIVVLDEADVLGQDVLKALSASFEVETYVDLDRSLVKLLEARYGVLVLGVDPYDPERAFNLTYTLRKAGNGAPILFVSPSRGLRSMTRSRGLRIGGDDFLLAELPPSEIVERIRVTAHRGHHRRNGSVRPDRHLQPRTETGEPRPMGVEELRQVLLELTHEAPTPFFALAVLETGDLTSQADLWNAVRPHLRLNDGDLVSVLPDGRLALVLNQVDSHLAERVLSRIRRTTPALAEMTPSTLFTSPLQEEKLRDWIEGLEKA
jgi:FixJ family two-component response regulator